MGLKIKICGITNLADARYAAAAGADYLGFIRYSKSPRFIELRSAAELIEWLFGPLSVGVYVNENSAVVNQEIEEAQFDLVQLHGDETVDDCKAITKPVIKAFRVGENDTVEAMRERMEPYRDAVHYFLIDAYHPTAYGGTGLNVDPSIAEALARDFPLMIAGGLTPENVLEVINSVKPAAIDLASGVESEPGKKDFEKLDALFSAFSESSEHGDVA